MRIGILTGGGDVPGLNACIKAVTRRASELGWEVIGFRRGWAGPLNYNLDDPEGSQKHLVHLTPALVRTIDRSGGTKLHTARMHPHEVKASDVPDFLKAEFATADGSDADCTPHILRVLEAPKNRCDDHYWRRWHAFIFGTPPPRGDEGHVHPQDHGQ